MTSLKALLLSRYLLHQSQQALFWREFTWSELVTDIMFHNSVTKHHLWLSIEDSSRINSTPNVCDVRRFIVGDCHRVGIHFTDEPRWTVLYVNVDSRRITSLESVGSETTVTSSSQRNEKTHATKQTRKLSWCKVKHVTAVRVWRSLSKKSTADQWYAIWDIKFSPLHWEQY